MSHGTTYFTDPNASSRNPTGAPQQPARSLGGKVWDGAKWAVGGTAWLASRPVAWAFAPVGDGIATGALNGAKREIETLVQPDGPLGIQLKQTLEQALLKQTPPEILQLKALLKKITDEPDKTTQDDVVLANTYLNLLSANECALLKQMAPDLSADGLRLCTGVFKLFKTAAETEHFLTEPGHRDLFVAEIKKAEIKGQLDNFNAVFNHILERNQGALIQSLAYLQNALLAEESGVLSKAAAVLEKKLTDEDAGLMKKVVEQFTALLDKKGGPLDVITNRLSEGDASVIGKAVALLSAKLLDKDGMVDKLAERFNHEETGIIANALKIAQKSFDQILKEGILLLKQELSSPDGLIAELRKKISGKDGVLDEAISLLKKSIFEEGEGMIPKMRAELTAEDKGILTEALKRLAKAINDEKEGILIQGIALLRKKLNDEDGVLADAIRLLEHKLNGPDGVLEKLQHRLLDEHDGMLIKALAKVQEKLNHEETGILSQAVSLLEKRLLAEKDGLVDKLGQKLSDPEKGILAQAVLSLKASLEKKDGPLDILDQRVQKTLADALLLLQNKCLDEKDGLLAQGLAMLQKKLNEENGVLDTLSKKLSDPNDGIIAKAVAQLNEKVLGKDGTFEQLQKKLLDETTGLVPQAIALIQAKITELQEQVMKEGGSADQFVAKLQKKLVDKDGILDQAMTLLDDKLNAEDKGILARAKKYLTDALTDEKEGIIAKAIELLNAKLRAKDGPIDYLEFRLTDKDTGILSKAAGVLQDKLMAKGGVVDQLDERLTGQAHPLLSKSREALLELRNAIIANNTAAIKKHSRALEALLEQLLNQRAIVFSKQALDSTALGVLQTIKAKLPAFYADTLPAQGEMMVAVEAALSSVNRYYEGYAGIAARTGDILRDTVTGALGPILDRVERLPKTMVDNLLGRTPSDPTTSPTASGPQSEGTVSQFIEYGGSLLSTLLSKGKDAISKQALSSVANILAIGLNQVLGKMENTPTFERARSTITAVIASLAQTQETGTWSELYTQLQTASDVLRGIKVYVNGFRIPNIGPSSGAVRNAEVLYSENMTALQEAIDDTPVQPQTQDWKTLAQAEKDKLVNNTANFLTIKHIYEDVCHLKPVDEKFYIQLMAKAKRNGKTSESELKKLFFEELDKGKVNFVTKLYARVQYYFYGGIVKRFTAKASTIYFNEIFDYIEKHKGANFEGLRNQVTVNFTRYLTILGGAYKSVSKAESPTGTLDEMLRSELEKKDANLGFETKELYMDFAQSIIKKTLNSTTLSWFAKKIIGNPEAIVRQLIDKATDSIQDTRGYTHALNSVILEQLDEVWSLLQAEMDGRSTGRDPIMLAEISEGKKAQLSGLVKNLFEILRKSKCSTVDELRDLVKGKLLSAKVTKAVDDLFIEEILEKVTNILAVTIQSLVKEDQLQKLTFKFASLVNRTFEVGEEVTVEQMQDVERKLAKRSEQILRLTINTAVEQKFDFSGKKQQEETNRFVAELHERSRTYFTTAEADLQALGTMDIATPEARNKVKKIVEEASAYQSECYESNFQAKSSQMNSDNKDEITARYLKIAEQSKPFVDAVKQLTMHARTLDHLQVTVPHLNALKDIVPAMALRLFSNTATAEDLDFAENQLSIIETHLVELRKMRSISAQVEQMTEKVREIATILVNLRKAIFTRELGLKLAQPNSVIEQIAAEKKQNLGPLPMNPALKDKINLFKQDLIRAVSPTFLPQLLGKLKNIEDAVLPQQVDSAHQEFIALLRQTVDHANLTLEQERQKYWLSYQGIQAAIGSTHLLEPTQAQTANQGLRASIGAAQNHLRQLSQWEEQNIRHVPYINFSVVDMKGLQDWASGLVYGRVRERLDGFLGFLKREETYRYGLLNHLFLIPYTQMGRAQPV